jgi:hypothetical protein
LYEFDEIWQKCPEFDVNFATEEICSSDFGLQFDNTNEEFV